MERSRTVKEAISRIYPAIGMDDSLADAIRLMAENNTSALVVKQGEDLIGLVTVSDVVYSIASHSDVDNTKIASFMTRCDIIAAKGTRNPCIQLDADMDVLSAITIMHEAGVNHLLVTGSDRIPVGVVSSLELVKLLGSSQQGPPRPF